MGSRAGFATTAQDSHDAPAYESSWGYRSARKNLAFGANMNP